MQQHESLWAKAVCAAAKTMQDLDPGQLAECRRMDGQTGAPAFWRLVAQHPNTIGRHNYTDQWMEIVRILAILTPKGDPTQRPDLHDSKRRLGEVLCDGGDPSWTGPTPVFSERRLAQLMAARGDQRAVLLRRAAQMLARSPGVNVNVVDIAQVLLQPENGGLLAEPYYRRLDRAEQNAKKSAEGVT